MIPYFTALGIDLGTSGLRMSVVRKHFSDQPDEIIRNISCSMPMPIKQANQSEQSTEHWQQALNTCLTELEKTGLIGDIDGIIADATSSTLLLMDATDTATGHALCPALMYDDKRATAQSEQLAPLLSASSGAQGATSSLAKALWLGEHYNATDAHLAHQIDWLNYQFIGKFSATDENNLLKLGYDSIEQRWPETLKQRLPFKLPTAVAAGSPIGYVCQQMQTHWGFRADCQVFAGTTDSIAAFLASGADDIGDAVSALGSTLAIKLLSDQPLFDAKQGIYSHKLGDKWLVGGASNVGGAVLLHHFSLDRIKQLVPLIDINQPTGLDCYPLIRAGERFPIADAHLAPIIPDTDNELIRLQALIEGLVRVEVLAYQKLNELGAPKVKRIFAVGGGHHNQAWSDLRAQHLPAKLAPAFSQSAAYGVTRLINLGDKT
jgi:xylulokinase